MTPQQDFSLCMARISCLLYGISLTLWMFRGKFPRLLWSTACLAYLIHMGTAFAFFHHFSHEAAYEATARQTEDLIGIDYGGGLYWNYVFTAVWVVDVLWAWLGNYEVRAKWITATIQSYLAFMFVNATVVFGKGWIRWGGIAGFLALGAIFLRKQMAVRGPGIGR